MGMRRKLPPFAGVRAFEAAARHGSFKEAADELCLTPSAVSHQIRALETYLNTQLFERRGNAMQLTMVGRAYAGKLTNLLDGLDHSTRSVREGLRRPLRVLCTPGFAARWMVPRLDRLAIGDRVRLRVSTGAPSTDFATNESDVVIQWSDTPVTGVRTEPFMESTRYPVISPELLRKSGIARPADLLRERLIYDETDDSWPEWFAAAGVTDADLPDGPVHPNCELATTAVEQGQGISLAYDAVVRGTLTSGRLVRLFDTVTLPRTIYSLAYPESRAGEGDIRLFRDWIFAEARAFIPNTQALEQAG